MAYGRGPDLAPPVRAGPRRQPTGPAPRNGMQLRQYGARVATAASLRGERPERSPLPLRDVARTEQPYFVAAGWSPPHGVRRVGFEPSAPTR